MHIKIPYIFFRGDSIFYRRWVPVHLRSKFGTEIKFKIGPLSSFYRLLSRIEDLSLLTVEEVYRVSKKGQYDDMNPYTIPRMMNESWDALTATLANDPPDDLTPERTRVLDTLRMYHTKEKQDGEKLSEIIEQFMQSREHISYSGKKQYQTSLNELLASVTDKTFRNITTEDIIKYRESILTRIYLSEKTKKGKLVSVSTFLGWSLAEGKTTHSLATTATNASVKAYKSSQGTGSGRLISDDDLVLIHDALKNEKNNCTSIKSDFRWRYWIFVLLMYQGARPNEICQLETNDILQEDNIWCISITDSNEKSVKNKFSRRIISLHPRVIALGFLDYVNDRKKNGHKQLFNLIRTSTGYSNYAGKWYRDVFYKSILQIDEKRQWRMKDSRAMIETQFDLLGLTDAETRIHCRITGRNARIDGIPDSTQAVRQKSYSLKDYTPRQMLDVLAKIKYPI